ncbi:MAG TPA: ABC transporter substrate binding protein [Woeseiaceae bacterium]|nr:ABC transporter substrate binding protein [Woeseiaceae bacterium]
MLGICRTKPGALRLAIVAGLLLLHGCALLEQEPEVMEPAPEVVDVPEPVAEVPPAPAPEPEPRPVAPAPPPQQVAIVLSSRQPAYEDVAVELSARLDNVAIYDLDDRSQPPVVAFRQINDSRTDAVIAIGLRAARSSVAMAQVPVIFSQVFNYTDYGLVTENSRGVSALPPLDAHLAAWKELDPTLARVGMIIGSGHEALRTEAEIAAQKHGVQVQIREAGSDQETLYHFKRMIHEIDGFWLFPDNRILSPRVLTDMLQQANRRHVPVAVSNDAMLQLGAAISVSTVASDIATTILRVLERIRAGKIDALPPVTQLSEIRVSTNDALIKPEVAADAADGAAQ